MRLFWIVGALISFGITIPVSISFYNDFQVFRQGKLVEVTIIKVPRCATYKSGGFLNFIFNDHQYDKEVSGSMCDKFYVGQKIQLRYLKGFENNFLFVNENPTYISILLIAMLLGGGVCSIYYAYKKQSLKLPAKKFRSIL